MKQLDFPVSAAAVHLHGREFHEQDFFVSSIVPSEHVDLPLAEDSASPAGADHVDSGRPAHGRESQLKGRFKKLMHWTLACLGLALAATVVLSWLVRPDIEHVKWVDNGATPAASKAH